MGMVRAGVIALLIGAAALGCSPAPPPPAPEPRTLRLAMDFWPGYYPAVLADELGYLREEGLALVLSTPSDTDAMLAEFAAGRHDLVGTALGLAFPLASLAAHAVDLMDLAMWAGVALAIQLLCWVVLARLVFPWMKAAIAANQTPAGLLLGGFSAGIGLLNAACLTY